MYRITQGCVRRVLYSRIDWTLFRRPAILYLTAQGYAAGFPQGRRFDVYGAGLVTAGFFFMFVDAPACKCILFSKEQANAALDVIKSTPGCEEILVPPPSVEVEPLSQEEECYMQSKAFTYSAQGKAPPEFEELENQASLGSSRMTAQEEARLHAFLRANGGFALKQTQELGNCMYSAVLRGTDSKREFTTMHLRRLLVVMVSQYPSFFLLYLKRPVGLKYGFERLSKKEIEKGRKKGTLSAKGLQDSKLPGPFSLHTYMQHILKNGTWGDDIVLQLISCLWQISVTILKADGLGGDKDQTQHEDQQVDLVVVHAGGDHYLGCGE